MVRSHVLRLSRASLPVQSNWLQARALHLESCSFKAVTNSNSPNKPKRRSIKLTQTELPRKYKMEWPKITLFGDSITRRSQEPENGCWASYIAHDLGNFFDVDVRGFDGYNSKWALELLPSLFPKSYLEKVDIFVPFFGHNDSFDSTSPLHVPVDQYELNMRSMVEYLMSNGLDSTKVIMITPTWYYNEDFQIFLKSLPSPSTQKSVADAQKYSEAIKRIANEKGIEFLDYFEYSLNYQPLKELFCDGIHFSQIGARKFYQSLMPLIRTKIEGRYKKPLADLWHVTPFDLRPEVKPRLEQFREVSLKRGSNK